MTMLKSLAHGGIVFAASLCAVLFTACGITPLYYPPVDDKSPEEMFDAEVCATLLKTGTLRSEDGDVTVSFSACRDDIILTEGATMKDSFAKYVVRGYATIVESGNKEKEEKAETWLPVLIVPFRSADKLFFFLTLDHMYIMEKYKLNPEYIFMTRPYSYILTTEAKDGGWEVGFVQFATKGLELKKIAEKAQTDKDGTVFNPPEEILEMLKDPKNYEISSKMLFKPVETEK